jgi:RNA polymerase sigma-70 factor (ECF subfamily)
MRGRKLAGAGNGNQSLLRCVARDGHSTRAWIHAPRTGEWPLADRTEARREAFEREALTHLDAVYRTALRLSGDPSDAEDLVQETMLKAYRAWDQYERGTNAKAWLLTILRNTYINTYRRAKARPVMVDVNEIEPYTVFRNVRSADPEAAFFSQIVDDRVTAAIATLPDEFREVLVLSDTEDLSYAEIAATVGIPVGTVKSRLFRARQLLQKQLYDYALAEGYVRPRREGQP